MSTSHTSSTELSRSSSSLTSSVDRSTLSISSESLANTFLEQKKYVDYFFEKLDYKLVERFVQIVLRCKGLLFLTGMGKSGIIARNISQMFVSVGVRAVYINPVDALHGDVGVMKADDVLVLFSKSGQTSELINLIPAVRNKKAYLVNVSCTSAGQLSKLCDETILLPLLKELCPFDMAPTTSTIIQLIFGNTVVAAIMKETQLTREEYAMNHPAGRIGKRLTVRVDDVMRSRDNLGICLPTDVLIDKIGLMSAKRCGCLILEQDGKLVGIFTDGDLRRAIELEGRSDTYAATTTPSCKQSIKAHKRRKQHSDSSTINQFKSRITNCLLSQFVRHQPATCRSGTMAYEAMLEMERTDATMNKKRVKELPIVDENGAVKGLITLHDLVQFGL